jgi:hypothetical protein
METIVCSYHAAQLHQQEVASIKYQVQVERALVKKPIGKLMNVAFKGKAHGKFALLHEAHNLIHPFTRCHLFSLGPGSLLVPRAAAHSWQSSSLSQVC